MLGKSKSINANSLLELDCKVGDQVHVRNIQDDKIS